MKYIIEYTEQVTYTAEVEAKSKVYALDEFLSGNYLTEENVTGSQAVYTTIEEVR